MDLTSISKLTAAERQAQALKLRMAGVTFQQIADTLGYKGKQGAHKAVMSALKKTLQEPADEYRQLQHERLSRLWRVAYDQAINGDLRAVDRCVSIHRELAKLFGLDAPVQVDWRVEAKEQGVDPEKALQTLADEFATMMTANSDVESNASGQ